MDPVWSREHRRADAEALARGIPNPYSEPVGQASKDANEMPSKKEAKIIVPVPQKRKDHAAGLSQGARARKCSAKDTAVPAHRAPLDENTRSNTIADQQLPGDFILRLRWCDGRDYDQARIL